MIVLNGILVPALALAVFQAVDRMAQLHKDQQAVMTDDVERVQDARELDERDVVDVLDFRTPNQRIGVCAQAVRFDFEPRSNEIRIGTCLAKNRVVAAPLVSARLLAVIGRGIGNVDHPDVFQRLFDAERRSPSHQGAYLIEPVLEAFEQRIVCLQHRLPRKRRIDDTAVGKPAPLTPAVAVVVNADDVPRRELLHQKEIFLVLVHAAHAKQARGRCKMPRQSHIAGSTLAVSAYRRPAEVRRFLLVRYTPNGSEVTAPTMPRL